MDRLEKISLLGLFVLALSLTVLLVSKRTDLMGTTSESQSPFMPDRVAEVRIVMDEKSWRQLQSNPMAKQYVRADFWYDGHLYPNVAVRPKGNSSLRHTVHMGSPRLSYKIDFNFFNSAQTFRGLKKLNLNNGFWDPTFIRETLAYELFEQMRLPTPRTSFVDVWINDIHLGLYTQVEQIDKTFLRRNFAQADGNLYKPEGPVGSLKWTGINLERLRQELSTSSRSEMRNRQINMGGSRLLDLARVLKKEGSIGSWKLPDDSTEPRGRPGRPFKASRGRLFPDRPGIRFHEGQARPFPGPIGSPPPGRPGRGFPPGPGGPFPGMSRPRRQGFLELMGLKTNENNQDHDALLHFLEVLNTSPDSSFSVEIEKVLDVDEVLRFLAVSTVLVHLDNYIGTGHNYYFYETKGKFRMLPWDMNMAFGTFSHGLDRQAIINLYIDEPTMGPVSERPVVARLLSHPPYLDRYHKYLEQLLNGAFAEGVIESRIDQLVEMIRPYVEADDLKFYSTEDFERTIEEDFKDRPVDEKQDKDNNRIRVNDPGRMRRAPGPKVLGLKWIETIKFIGRRMRRAGGPKVLGLKAFIRERRASVRKQLDGKLPSKQPEGDSRQGSYRPGMIMRRPERQR